MNKNDSFYINDEIIEMISIIYNYCVYLTIIFNIGLMKLIFYYIHIQIKRFIRLSNKENVYVLIKEIKYELIKDFEIYSSIEINEIINDIIQIYINHKCDFAEDYDNNQKIYYSDIDVFILTKKKQIIKDIKQKLLLNYNTDYDEKFELSILIIS